MNRRSHRRGVPSHLIAFLLIASFGILFAGCKGPSGAEDDSFVFTEDDVARYRELSQDDATGTGSSSGPYLEPLASGSGTLDDDSGLVLNLGLIETYASMRTGTTAAGKDMYQVTNDFLNVRAQPSTTAESLARFEFGAPVQVTEFLNGTWAKVKLSGGQEGYVAHRYVSKVTSEERLADEKKQFEGMYYVSFGFVNMRKEANQSSEKLTEVPGQTIVKPSSIANGWAKVSYDGKDGYVSMSYLSPFMPNFIVRQEQYDLPVLHYRLAKDGINELLAQLTEHANALRAEGMNVMTLKQFYDLLLQQQERDVRLPPNNVVIAISGITPDNIRAVSESLNAGSLNATLFVETKHVGISGITEKNIITLMANGFDVQPATHSGDDLRALTNQQVKLELEQSKKILEDLTKRPAFAVAWPQGGVNDRVMQIAAEAGYLLGIADDADRTFSRGQFLRIPAMVIFPSMTKDEVVKFATGA